MNLADDVLRIDFERTLVGAEQSVLYTGSFLCDREILVGKFKAPDVDGDFLFKKVPESSVLLWRPMVPQLSAKQLWSFAYNAVIDSIRRKNLGLSYLHARMTDMHQFLELMHKEESPDMFTEADEAEYVRVQKTFTFGEVSELSRLFRWYSRIGRRQPM